MNFQECEAAFRADRLDELAENPDGLFFLKLRSLSRTEYLAEFARELGLNIAGLSASSIFRHVFESVKDRFRVDLFIRATFGRERALRCQAEPALINELYKLQIFDWGGLHQNSLEKTIVDNYVKKIREYDAIVDCVDNELHLSLRGYVLNSWYNHWTSIMIEDIFREHVRVLPAVGQIKKIDFFVDDRPFDLKVSYLPEGYIAARRRSAGHRPELTVLKQSARSLDIPFDKDLPPARLLEDLWLKHADHPNANAQDAVKELAGFRTLLIQEGIDAPAALIRWLYENQGVRRFDASNRLFLLLVDEGNFFESWKLKRARPLLATAVGDFLREKEAPIGHHVNFEWEGEQHSATADVIFAIKPNAN